MHRNISKLEFGKKVLSGGRICFIKRKYVGGGFIHVTSKKIGTKKHCVTGHTHHQSHKGHVGGDVSSSKKSIVSEIVKSFLEREQF